MTLSVSNSEAFAIHIERMVKVRHLSYMEAVVEFCSTRDLEPETIVPYLSDKIKRAIAVEAQSLHLLQKSAELPFEDLT
jgi:hypothetical protein